MPSLETAARSISSKSIAAAVFTSVTSVREGKGLSSSLKQTGIFPNLATEMVEVGESTGALPQMLNSVAEFFEEDVQTALTAALSLIEPVILIIMRCRGRHHHDCPLPADDPARAGRRHEFAVETVDHLAG